MKARKKPIIDLTDFYNHEKMMASIATFDLDSKEEMKLRAKAKQKARTAAQLFKAGDEIKVKKYTKPLIVVENDGETLTLKIKGKKLPMGNRGFYYSPIQLLKDMQE